MSRDQSLIKLPYNGVPGLALAPATPTVGVAAPASGCRSILARAAETLSAADRPVCTRESSAPCPAPTWDMRRSDGGAECQCETWESDCWGRQTSSKAAARGGRDVRESADGPHRSGGVCLPGPRCVRQPKFHIHRGYPETRDIEKHTSTGGISSYTR